MCWTFVKSFVAIEVSGNSQSDYRERILESYKTIQYDTSSVVLWEGAILTSGKDECSGLEILEARQQ